MLVRLELMVSNPEHILFGLKFSGWGLGGCEVHKEKATGPIKNELKLFCKNLVPILLEVYYNFGNLQWWAWKSKEYSNYVCMNSNY